MASPVANSSVSISTAALSAEISATGAELVRLQDRTGADLLWDGNPAVWNGRSALLFPIVGEVAGNRLKVAGKAYEIGRHGFARTSTFALNNATIGHALTLANQGWKQALKGNAHLKNGLNVAEGQVTYEAVAQALGKPYVPADSLL